MAKKSENEMVLSTKNITFRPSILNATFLARLEGRYKMRYVLNRALDLLREQPKKLDGQ